MNIFSNALNRVVGAVGLRFDFAHRPELAEGPKLQASAHAGASLDDKAMLSWNPVKGSPDADLLPHPDTLVARSRDLARNNGVAQGAMQPHLVNTVGTR